MLLTAQTYGSQGNTKNKANLEPTKVKTKERYYFPIQKLAKILPKSSSLVTCPVISPK